MKENDTGDSSPRQTVREWLISRRGWSGSETICTSLSVVAAECEAWAELREAPQIAGPEEDREDLPSVGINRGGHYWCAECGDLPKGACQHFPVTLQGRPELAGSPQEIGESPNSASVVSSLPPDADPSEQLGCDRYQRSAMPREKVDAAFEEMAGDDTYKTEAVKLAELRDSETPLSHNVLCAYPDCGLPRSAPVHNIVQCLPEDHAFVGAEAPRQPSAESREKCDRAELIVSRAENCWITVHDREQLVRNIRLALDTEVEAGGPYLLRESRQPK
jgi:hypothetical protein